MAQDVHDRIEKHSRTNPETGCLEWVGAKDPCGYGKVEYKGKLWGAHRLTWVLLYGDPPEGTEFDHLCRNRACINPTHLEPVSHAENTRRGGIGDTGAKERERTHCPQGHPYDEKNTRYYKNMRFCRECGRERHRRYMKNRRETL